MLSKSTLKFIRQLHQKKYRSEEKLFIAEGEKVVRELLNSTFTIQSLYATGSWLNINHRPASSIDVHTVSEKELAAISVLESPNNVAAIVKQQEISFNEFRMDKNYLLLDSIRDPGNMGTLLRIAEWFGIEHVLGEGCVELYNPKVVQASMGSIFRMKYSDVMLSDVLNRAKERPVIHGAVLNGKSIYDVKFGSGSILIIGNESTGISEGVSRLIEQSVTIPSYASGEGPESLNAAIATAVCYAEVLRQQHK